MEVYLDENSKSGMVSLVFKMLSFCVVPLPCLNNWTYVNYDYYNQISFPDKYNYLLILLSIPRLGFCVSYLFARSKFMTPRAIRICKLHGAQPGLVYCLKSIFKDNSFILVSTIFIASLILFSFAFRIA